MPKTILIVDDCEDNLFILSLIIKSVYKDVNILKASTGKEALNIFVNTIIDVLIMDYNMPDWDGVDTLNNISYYLRSKIGKTLKDSLIKYYIFTAAILKPLTLHDGSDITIIEKPINKEKITYMIGE
jgi:CheY-like chemotaxis protein